LLATQALTGNLPATYFTVQSTILKDKIPEIQQKLDRAASRRGIERQSTEVKAIAEKAVIGSESQKSFELSLGG
jgi:hypothetical protein